MRDLETDADFRAIVRAIISLGTSLGMRVLAEGVETEGQLEILRAEGCGRCRATCSARRAEAPTFPR